MEQLGQQSGYILYRSKILRPITGELTISGLRDYAVVFVDGKKIGLLDRRHKHGKLQCTIKVVPAYLDILVENGGRINYGKEIQDNRKGIVGGVTIGGLQITNWENIPLPMDDLSDIAFNKIQDSPRCPCYLYGIFSLAKIGDTYLDMSGWGKGCVWVNGHNLGRYWYIGPQQTLYLPGAWLKKGENEVIVFAYDDSVGKYLQGVTKPILNQLNPDKLNTPFSKRIAGKLILDFSDLILQGTFVRNDSVQQFNCNPTIARYICLQSLSSLDNDPFATIAEFNVYNSKSNRIDHDAWKIYYVDSEELTAEDGRAENAYDDDPETFWHSQWSAAKPPHPHEIVIDLGSVQTITGFSYMPRMYDRPGKIKDFKFYGKETPFSIEK
jgi:beta-galactosidase